MLQQTTVAQGTDYYLRFVKKFPTVKDLAKAPLDDVLKLWEGLGYYSRARNLHHTAKDIIDNYGGVFPATYETIIKLKGIGPYTAAAISSFVYGLPHVVVDGNVMRVISRYYGIKDPVDTPPVKKKITKLGQQLLEQQDPAEFNQAVMEFGALCCTYKNPLCTFCPLIDSCKAYNKNLIHLIPKKSKKIKKRHRYFQFLILLDKKNRVLVEPRVHKDIWQGLYQFPLIETPTPPESAAPELPPALITGPLEYDILDFSKEYKQTLTHQYITARFYTYKINRAFKKKLPEGMKAIAYNSLDTLAFPKIVLSYFKDVPLSKRT